MTESFIAAARIRTHIAERKASVIETLLSGACENMEDYAAAVARHHELSAIADEIDAIVKETNNA